MSNWQTKGYVPDSEGEDDEEDILETQTEGVVGTQAQSPSSSQRGNIRTVHEFPAQITPPSLVQGDQDVVDLSIFDFPGDDTPASTPVTKRKSGIGITLTNSDNDQLEDYRTLKKAKTQVELTSFDDGGFASRIIHDAEDVVVQDSEIMEIEQVELVRQ